ncbi:GAF sensor signal transduction histidine kinase [Mesonia phycicola]|uniref:histidine kinase n=1 Tax=Mesonia phycicola TaxID=579105 RepID=A0A1M6DQD4_9FLAO|nr:GAF domain-containing sensor histidine kinase [Mesonia phycicola]SHI75412.1 GAF sensor signal transduction histidine kinase [Mesonia phycicola]
MIIPKTPLNEVKRLKALKNLGILNTNPEQEFDDLVALAALVCNTPVSLITFIEEKRQWFKAKIGTDLCETDREVSFCGHAINNSNELMIVEDATKDERFIDNPLTKLIDTPVIFYAGMPLTDKEGNSLGTLCVIDHKPKSITKHQQKALKTIANQVVKMLELRVRNNNLKITEEELRQKNNLLKDFAGVVSHDLKMPLTNMIITADILKEKYSEQLDNKGKQYLDYLKQSSFALSDYITKILAHYETDDLSKKDLRETFDIHHLLEEIIDLFNIKEDCEINFPENNIDIYCNRVALEQILLNLLGNSLKYNDKDKIIVDIECIENSKYYQFTIKDNGIGIPKEKQNNIFELFSTANQLDRNGKKGNGIGLSTVKKIINNMGGEISVNSKLGKETTFTFTIKKNVVKKTA